MEETILATHVNEQKKNSWIGKGISEKSLQLKEDYSLTKFSTTLAELNITDAEKALEIAILTILEIRNMIPGSYSDASLNFRIPKNNMDGTSLNNVLNVVPRRYSDK